MQERTVDGTSGALAGTSYKPTSDINRDRVHGVSSDTVLYSDVDDGTTVGASNGDTSYVRALAGVGSGSFTVGYSGVPAGTVTSAQVVYTATRGTATTGTVQALLFDGATQIAAGRVNAVNGWTAYSDTFTGLNVLNGNNLRTKLILTNQSGSGAARLGEVYLTVATGSISPDGGTPCVPTTCAAQGKNCDTLPDGCGGTLSCGNCTAPDTCGGGGTANVCGKSGGTPDAGTPPGGSTITIGAAGDINGSNAMSTSDIMFSAPTVYGAVLTLGDNSYSSSYSVFNSSWGRMKAKLYPSTGNHDYSYTSSYDAAMAGAAGGGSGGHRYYSANIGDWHIISVDSSSDLSAGGTQLTWLKNDLAANAGKKCTLAFWHHPRWSSGATHGSQSQMAAVWDILYAANVDVVLNGHDHEYERFSPQTPTQASDPVRGITEYVVGTGGAGFYSLGTLQANSRFFQSNQHGILKLTLKPTGWDSVFVPVNGGTPFDPSSGVCH